MIYTPIIIHKEPAKCPKCDRPEDIKEVCAHCGHEYRCEGHWLNSWLLIPFCIMVAIVFISVTFVFLDWIVGGKPLVRVLKDRVAVVSNIRIFEEEGK